MMNITGKEEGSEEDQAPHVDLFQKTVNLTCFLKLLYSCNDFLPRTNHSSKFITGGVVLKIGHFIH